MKPSVEPGGARTPVWRKPPSSEEGFLNHVLGFPEIPEHTSSQCKYSRRLAGDESSNRFLIAPPCTHHQIVVGIRAAHSQMFPRLADTSDSRHCPLRERRTAADLH